MEEEEEKLIPGYATTYEKHAAFCLPCLLCNKNIIIKWSGVCVSKIMHREESLYQFTLSVEGESSPYIYIKSIVCFLPINTITYIRRGF